VGAVAVIVAEQATANNASALAGTWPSIQIKKSVRIAAVLADAPLVATPESSRLELPMIDRSWCRSRAVSLAEHLARSPRRKVRQAKGGDSHSPGHESFLWIQYWNFPGIADLTACAERTEAVLNASNGLSECSR
jgi:hypothetical protein